MWRRALQIASWDSAPPTDSGRGLAGAVAYPQLCDSLHARTSMHPQHLITVVWHSRQSPIHFCRRLACSCLTNVATYSFVVPIAMKHAVTHAARSQCRIKLLHDETSVSNYDTIDSDSQPESLGRLKQVGHLQETKNAGSDSSISETETGAAS